MSTYMDCPIFDRSLQAAPISAHLCKIEQDLFPIVADCSFSLAIDQAALITQHRKIYLDLTRKICAITIKNRTLRKFSTK